MPVEETSASNCGVGPKVTLRSKCDTGFEVSTMVGTVALVAAAAAAGPAKNSAASGVADPAGPATPCR
ncbi:hypothetical protein [Actinokineospora cianjurensis]|uniref:hypothetical protein n=1 Tax=Actinokineospora cianjurensis TaxID=585224 RepID=UPI00147744E1|nr:hypothetical protein [Actinokineospora cianjurensis]